MKHVVIYNYFVILPAKNNGCRHKKEEKAYILPYRDKITNKHTFSEKKIKP